MKTIRRLSVILGLAWLAGSRGEARGVELTVLAAPQAPELAPRFLGLSYESSMLLPQAGKYYFDAQDQALVRTFQTLGIRSLRVGANAVDDPKIPVPRAADVDRLFDFARAAGVTVIYSFRLKDGDPQAAAALAARIAARDAGVLDCFAIGNEPNFYLRTFAAYYAQWQPEYAAILRAVPDARFEGPSVAGRYDYVEQLVERVGPGGHLAMATSHYYFLGSGRAGEKDPAATRARFLAEGLHAEYARSLAATGARLAAMGVPYRIDELNSCYNGGAKGASDTYAATLWALDCTHWWAAHHILGMNYHTGESVGRDGGFGAANYAAFVHAPDGRGFVMRPQAYAYLAFSEGARGRSLPVRLDGAEGLALDAYAYEGDDHSVYVTLINKQAGAGAAAVAVTLHPPGGQARSWMRMDLLQAQGDIAATSGITLGGGAVDREGNWPGRWQAWKTADGPAIEVPAASAVLLKASPPAGE